MTDSEAPAGAGATRRAAAGRGELPDFEMERWQSRHEHHVDYNLSDSGAHPFTLDELLRETGAGVGDQLLGYVQTNGTVPLRERIARLYDDAGPENVLVTTGGAEANFLALWELVSAGDRVVFQLPTYGQTPGLARWLGAEVDSFRLEEGRGWQVAPGAAREAITSDTRLVVVTNPNNPTGARLSAETREEIVDAAADAGAWILSDEVYRGAELDGRETASLWGEYGRVIVTHSLSKAYGLPGLRLGWLAGPEEAIERLWGRKDYTSIAPAALSDRLAAAALDPEHRPAVLERTRELLQENLDRLTGWLDRRPELFAYREPEAGAICFVRYRMDVNSTELADRLRREKSVLLVPGDQFGMDGYLRIGFGNPSSELESALDRVGALVEEIAGRG
ncbi:MAG: aminotransferase class I/II-fold pyridoxal phosphate-dependent enzyme [Candidatus Palauibacterales bacterium]|nr:aminotransferase class I/II-fold pyridoxal phosphate-dependent enzyme [Candidatus Palauibacterales bacterium]